MFVCPSCGQGYERSGFCAADGEPLVEATDPLLGSEVGRYRIARLLGEGGMGQVFLGVQPMIGSRVAIKVLSKECTRNPELLERFFAEARAVNLIRHENIVSVLDMAQLPDGRPYIVMEFVEGLTLGRVVRSGAAPLGGVVQVMTEVLGALGAAHALGIVHRDLKPDNVLVTGEGHAKVLDFGIAKLAPGLSNALSPRTRTGALLGTPAYMAPEQISGAENVDARTDIYAAGVVLFEACTGRVPFHGDTLFDLMRAHLEQAPPSPRALRSEIPAALESVILTALAKEPARRFQTTAAMTEALHHAARELPPGAWRALSSRGGMITGRPSIEQMASPSHLLRAYATTATPTAPPTERDPERPAPAATTAPRRTGLVVALLAIAAVGGGVALIVASRGGGGEQPPVVAGSGSSDAPVLVARPPTPPAGGGPIETPPAPPTAPSAPPAAPPRNPPPAPSRPRAPTTTPADPPPTIVQTPPGPPPTTGPTIVGGGSAADHGVHLGPGVQVGPGVIVGGDPPAQRAQIVRPADYDPKRFDPVAYLPRAQALARQLLPDARLTYFEFDPVFSDGRVDLTVKGRDREYEFRSVKASARPAGVPRNLPVEDRPCIVHVEVGPKQVVASIRTRDDCDERLIRAPRCRFKDVWAMAKAANVAPDLVARIGWLEDEAWFFDTDLAGKGGGVKSFADQCP